MFESVSLTSVIDRIIQAKCKGGADISVVKCMTCESAKEYVEEEKRPAAKVKVNVVPQVACFVCGRSASLTEHRDECGARICSTCVKEYVTIPHA